MKRVFKLAIPLLALAFAPGCAEPEPAAHGGSASTIPSDETYTTAGGEDLDDDDLLEESPEAQ